MGRRNSLLVLTSVWKSHKVYRDEWELKFCGFIFSICSHREKVPVGLRFSSLI